MSRVARRHSDHVVVVHVHELELRAESALQMTILCRVDSVDVDISVLGPSPDTVLLEVLDAIQDARPAR